MTPAHSADYPPAAPGPGATPWRCRCGNLLGILYRRWLYSRHRGRTVEAALPARVRCEACGRKQVRTAADVAEQADPADPASGGGDRAG